MSARLVRRITGMDLVSSVPLSSWSTIKPSMSGIMTSRRIREKVSSLAARRPSCAVWQVVIS